jgi:C1A family cysteine protease
MPKLATESVQGGHAILVVGYNSATQLFRVRNSWSPSWGMGGYFTIPFDYFTDPEMASDFWLCQRLS